MTQDMTWTISLFFMICLFQHLKEMADYRPRDVSGNPGGSW